MEIKTANFLKGTLRYRIGDACEPPVGGHKLIIHVVNDIGAWGRGFVTSLSKHWPKPEQQYRLWWRGQTDSVNRFTLGNIQTIQLNSDLSVVNMLAQHGIYPENGVPPIRLDAVESCLEKVAVEVKQFTSSVHCPRFGSGLAAGKQSGYCVETWNKIEKMLQEILVDKGINVTVYDLSKWLV